VSSNIYIPLSVELCLRDFLSDELRISVALLKLIRAELSSETKMIGSSGSARIHLTEMHLLPGLRVLMVIGTRTAVPPNVQFSGGAPRCHARRERTMAQPRSRRARDVV
jgi:hypothetical protein